MVNEGLSPEERAKTEVFIAEYFPGTAIKDRRVVNVDLKVHTFLKIYSRTRGYSLQMTVQHLISEGMEYELKALRT